MVSHVPLVYTWTGDGWIPARGYAAQAARQFKPGETRILEVREERSGAAHRHYFAAVSEAFQNLDERCTERLKTPDHLRKWALIETGFYDEVITDCGSHEVALRMAAFSRAIDDYAEIRVRGNLLSIRRAKSQKVTEMDKEHFKRSSDAVLDLLSDMLHVSRTVLKQIAGKVA